MAAHVTGQADADEMTDAITRKHDSAPPSRRNMRELKKSPAHLHALERVRTWTRERFRLADDAPVVVAEVACGLPGCPPLETVVAFWTAGDRRHQFKLFKPVEAVVCDDLPFVWLLDSLAASAADSDCC
jgi:hypothetical protein